MMIEISWDGINAAFKSMKADLLIFEFPMLLLPKLWHSKKSKSFSFLKFSSLFLLQLLFVPIFNFLLTVLIDVVIIIFMPCFLSDRLSTYLGIEKSKKANIAMALFQFLILSPLLLCPCILDDLYKYTRSLFQKTFYEKNIEEQSESVEKRLADAQNPGLYQKFARKVAGFAVSNLLTDVHVEQIMQANQLIQVADAQQNQNYQFNQNDGSDALQFQIF